MKFEEVVKNLLSLFILGYVIVFFSTLFKGGTRTGQSSEVVSKER